jgi:hypothetical protein
MKVKPNWRGPYGLSLKQYFIVPFELNGVIPEQTNWMSFRVGTVKKKNDGRWEYTLLSRKVDKWGKDAYHPKVLSDTIKQGVAATEAEAKFLVESNYSDVKVQ